MALRLTCPRPADLELLVLGHLDPDEITAVQEHLARCPNCLATVAALDVEDPLVRAMRAPVAASAEDTDVEGLIARLRGAGPNSGLSDTLARDPAGAAHTPAPDPPKSFDFLDPPQGPGELGWLGPYRVVRVLGMGGMGIVFEAEDHQLRRAVALKVMKPNMARHPDAGQRFLREARAAAAIQHDHIVTIHQVGEDRGIPYLAMQLLSGETLERRLQRMGRRPVAEVVRVGREIAKGLAAAHARGLIHRDVKPANIWIEAPGDGSVEAPPAGRVKLLDFGLARAATEVPQPGQSALLSGTPAYMAPEQAADGPADQRADLFSLGCVLYQMSTNELPFKGTKPLTILWALAVKDPPPVRRLNPDVPPALSDLVRRLLSKDPAGRPRSAVEVAAALRDIDPSATVRSAPRPRRWRAPLAWVAAAVLVAFTAYWFGPTVYRLATNRGTVIVESDDPDVTVIVKDKDERITILDAKTRQKVTLRAGDYQVEMTGGQPGLGVSAREFALTRGGKQIVQVRWKPAGEILTLHGHQDFVWSARFCLGGTHVVSVGGNRIEEGEWVKGKDFAVRLWDLKTGREVGRLADHTEIVRCVAVSPDGRRAVSVGGDRAIAGGKDFILRLWDLEGKKLIPRFVAGHTDRVNSVTFTADGRHVVSASDDRTVRLWEVETGQQVRAFTKGETEPVWSADVSADGTRLVSGNYAGVLRRWDARTGDPIHKPVEMSEMALGSVTFLADGRRTLTQRGNDAGVWDLQTPKPVVLFTGHSGWLGRLAISPDGRRVLSGSADRSVRLWDVATGKELYQFDGHKGPVYDVAFSPDGRFAVSASWDRTVRIWKLPD
jgi:WD40 repeat protein/tRNA A-37 threonylcarbamoyl transferase component Bud32